MLSAKKTEIYPRRRRGEEKCSREPLSLDEEQITKLFCFRQTEAADFLGISLTALKNACRRIGMQKWPYSRNRIKFTCDSEQGKLLKSKVTGSEISFAACCTGEALYDDPDCLADPSASLELDPIEIKMPKRVWYDEDLFQEAFAHVVKK
ncbi:hypothetical protein GUITHDRAFT_119506 [Guillardia theta CCMP2712]|uniref:RWP-RK domain-containing protein n=1 Tax=Guillardia theta (strain CCMP2712) TaxID=905079 RepID=L1IET5_GUITC|nr:hypothetical protein GUITHDRAFT_119506 [Guillardia theta CCMP2712]EKX34340.1 hypothetical protein GUITHDRAFT_119506 [Guillardia theta CCMP2712]|eukprot:XP_005821320.1 hypothetical protein GUITHDRAFT_119506 [Guillardia theta CCMP2712]